MNLDIRNPECSPGYFKGEEEQIAAYLAKHKPKKIKPGVSGLHGNTWKSNAKKKRRGQTLEEMGIEE